MSLEYRRPAGGRPPKLADIPRQRPAPGQASPCKALRNQRRYDAGGTGLQDQGLHRAGRHASGRISRSFLPSRSSTSSLATFPAVFRLHRYQTSGDAGQPALRVSCATAAAVYEGTGLSIPPLCEICASRQPSQMNSRRPRRIAVRCRTASVVQGRPQTWHAVMDVAEGLLLISDTESEMESEGAPPILDSVSRMDTGDASFWTLCP